MKIVKGRQWMEECYKSRYHSTTNAFRSGSWNPGSQISANYTEPMDYFKSFFTELIKKLVDETDRYANKKNDKHLSYTNVTSKEIQALLYIILHMGTIPLPNLKECWSTDNKSGSLTFPKYSGETDFSKYFGCFMKMKTQTFIYPGSANESIIK